MLRKRFGRKRLVGRRRISPRDRCGRRPGARGARRLGVALRHRRAFGRWRRIESNRLDPAGGYRLTNGKIGGTYLHGIPVLLLTVVGRKSGRRITVPLTYILDGERAVVAASRTGMDHHPAWYLNLVAHPEVEVQIGGDTRPMRATTADDGERATLWPKLVAANPDYGTYQRRTARKIPVVVLTPR